MLGATDPESPVVTVHPPSPSEENRPYTTVSHRPPRPSYTAKQTAPNSIFAEGLALKMPATLESFRCARCLFPFAARLESAAVRHECLWCARERLDAPWHWCEGGGHPHRLAYEDYDRGSDLWKCRTCLNLSLWTWELPEAAVPVSAETGGAAGVEGTEAPVPSPGNLAGDGAAGDGTGESTSPSVVWDWASGDWGATEQKRTQDLQGRDYGELGMSQIYFR
ncbi:hypothetical protein DL771_011646 [Monosporascus sp. 5C6A]|nr:hypothetical protein DL771_011646 [Monosporascus sp. 5C6A]